MTPASDNPILHVAWARDRALYYLDPERALVSPEIAVTSLVSDLEKHEATRVFWADTGKRGIEILRATTKAERPDKVRIWIELTCAVLISELMKAIREIGDRTPAESTG